MKHLFFLVVLANAVLFMWEYKSGALAPATATAPNATPDLEPILLVSEMPPPPAPTAPPETGPPEPVTQAETNGTTKKAKRCYEAGPFTDTVDAKQWISQFAEAETTVKLISKDGQTPNKYMVYYPADQGLAKAEANLQMLKERGINDLFIQQTEKDKGNISLGVFSKEERALMLKKQLLIKGIETKIKTLYKTKTQQYALIESDAKTIGQLETLQKTTPQVTIKELFPCN